LSAPKTNTRSPVRLVAGHRLDPDDGRIVRERRQHVVLERHRLAGGLLPPHPGPGGLRGPRMDLLEVVRHDGRRRRRRGRRARRRRGDGGERRLDVLLALPLRQRRGDLLLAAAWAASSSRLRGTTLVFRGAGFEAASPTSWTRRSAVPPLRVPSPGRRRPSRRLRRLRAFGLLALRHVLLELRVELRGRGVLSSGLRPPAPAARSCPSRSVRPLGRGNRIEIGVRFAVGGFDEEARPRPRR
jgi:hypothetical protein